MSLRPGGAAVRRARFMFALALALAAEALAGARAALAETATAARTTAAPEATSPVEAPSTDASPLTPLAPPQPQAIETPAQPGSNGSTRPAPAGPIPPEDQALTLLGSWKCETMSDLEGAQTYTRTGPVEIDLRNDIRDQTGRWFRISQQFRYDRSAAHWSTSLQSGQFVGTAGEWLDADEQWTFQGKLNGTQGPVRIVYTNLGPLAFRRDFQKKVDGRWQTLDLETCKRAGGR